MSNPCIDVTINPLDLDWSPTEDTGYVDPFMEDTSDNLAMLGDEVRDFPSSLWIEPKDWKTYVADNKLWELDAEAVKQRFTNQGAGAGIRGTHECTCHSLSQQAEAAIMAQNGGDPDRRIALSQIGIYAIANPGQWGGANVRRVLQIAMQYGFIPERIWGQEDKFDHTLWGTCGKGNANNSRGPWVTPQRNPEYFSGASETRQQIKPTEILNPRSREEMACLVLHRRCVGVGRRGHAVPYNRLVWQPGQRSEAPTFAYSDSYDVIRYDTWEAAAASVGSGTCIWSMSC
jgi:hypothetical protein